MYNKYGDKCDTLTIHVESKLAISIKGPGTALIETEPFQVYTNENHSLTHRISQIRLYLLSTQIRSNIYIHYIYKRKTKCTVGCTRTTLIYSSEVSTNLPNYKSEKSTKIFKKSSVICTTRVGCSNFHISSI